MKGTSLPERVETDFAASRSGGDAAGVRTRAAQAFAQLGIPGPRDENWKYANLRALERVRFAPAASVEDVVVAAALPSRIEGFARQVFVDGRHQPRISDATTDAHGAMFRVRPFAGDMRDGVAPSAIAQHRDARFALLNTAFATDEIEISAASGGTDLRRIELVFVGFAEGAEAASYPRVRVNVAPGASLELIERHVSARDAASFIAPYVDLAVADGGRCAHVRLQELGPRAVWVDTLIAHVGSQARYELHSVALGAASARSTAMIQLAREGAETAVHSAAVADRHQVIDGFVRVQHAAPRATTAQVFRGIGGGRSRVAFNGMVVVDRDARGTDSTQSLRGLIAGPEAEVDVRPQLEIYTDDVRCSHGATVGTLDESMLFYLLSRGIDRATAQSLLEWAFLEDVVAKIPVPDVRRHVEKQVAGRLRAVTDLRELI